MQVVPWILGIAHPTGFPAFTLIGFAFAHALPLGPVAARIAALSALCTATTALLVWRIVFELDEDPWAACGAAWLFAFGEVVWLRSTRAEVHTMALLFAIATLYFALRWYRQLRAGDLFASAAACGLGVATHPIAALVAPAALALIVARLPRLRVRTAAAALAIFIAGVALYAYLPLRSAYVSHARLDPTLALGEAPGKPFWDNDHPATLQGFKLEISGSEYGAAQAAVEMLHWQTYLASGEYVVNLVREITPLGAALLVVGFFATVWRRRMVAAALFLAAFLPTAFVFAYTIEADSQRYDLIGFAIAAAFAGLGCGAIARWFPTLRAAGLAVLFASSAWLLVAHAGIFGQRTSTGAAGVIEAARQKTAPNAILIAPWLYATPLAYGAYVDRSLGARTVETAWLAEDAGRVPTWTRTRPVYVVGILFGSVPGYNLNQVAHSPDIWKVVKR